MIRRNATRVWILILALVWPVCVLAVEFFSFLVTVLFRNHWKIQYRAFWREFKEGKFR